MLPVLLFSVWGPLTRRSFTRKRFIIGQQPLLSCCCIPLWTPGLEEEWAVVLQLRLTKSEMGKTQGRTATRSESLWGAATGRAIAPLEVL